MKLENDKEVPDKIFKKKSLFLSPDSLDEWNSHFHFIPKEIRDMVIERNTLRMQRLFEASDALKEEIWELGFGLRDSEGTVHVWVRRPWK